MAQCSYNQIFQHFYHILYKYTTKGPILFYSFHFITFAPVKNLIYIFISLIVSVISSPLWGENDFCDRSISCMQDTSCVHVVSSVSVDEMVLGFICHKDAVFSSVSSNLNVECSSRSKGGKTNYNQGDCRLYRIRNSAYLQGRSPVCRIFNILALGFSRSADRYVYAVGRIIV